MSAPKKDFLWFNAETGRMVRGDYELHCGDAFNLLVDGKWHLVRIEHSKDLWYLIFYGTYDDSGTFSPSASHHCVFAYRYLGHEVRRER